MTKKLLAGASALAFIVSIGAASAQSGAQQERNNTPGASPSQSQGGAMKEPEGRSQQGERPGAAKTQDSEKKAQQGAGENNQRQGQNDATGTQQRQGQQGQGTTQRQGQSQDKDTQKRDGQAQRDSQSGGGKANVELNSEQRTKISQTIKTQNVKRVERTNINFNISVGTVVPRTYSFYPVPATVIAVVPAWRGYLYLVVGDEMLIIHPRTHEIVAVIAV
jgi:hypothetical protein